MYCTRCGNKQDDDAIFCNHCGSTIVTGEKAGSDCGINPRENQPNERPSFPPLQPGYSAQIKNANSAGKKQGFLWLLLLFATSIIVLTGTYFYYTDNDSKTDSLIQNSLINSEPDETISPPINNFESKTAADQSGKKTSQPVPSINLPANKPVANNQIEVIESQQQSQPEIKEESVQVPAIIKVLPQGASYEGEWSAPNLQSQVFPHGKGKLILANGDVYQGEFKNGRKDGEGTYTMPDGNSYSGYWKNDQKHGSGYEFYYDPVNHWQHREGTWQNNVYVGK